MSLIVPIIFFSIKTMHNTMLYLIKPIAALVSLAAGFSASGLYAEAWGSDPSHNMVREAKNLPAQLDDSTLIWEIDTDSKHQYPMPAIVGDKVLVGADGGGNPGVWGEVTSKGGSFTAYNLEDGSMEWRLVVLAHNAPGGYGTCGTPVVQGDRVYLMSMLDVFCLDLDGLEDGNQGMPAEEELAFMTRRLFGWEDNPPAPTELPDWAADIIWHTPLTEFGIRVQDATSSSIIEVDGQIWVSTANEIGQRARSWDGVKRPRLLVLDKETGKIIARDDIDVPIVFHGEWSSPSLVVDDNGQKAVVFPDGYGVLNAFAIPKPAADGSVVKLERLWGFDMNPPEWRNLPDGREIIYTGDVRLDYKYPEGYHEDSSKFYQFVEEDEIVAEGRSESYNKYMRGQIVHGRDTEIMGPSEVISMPAVAGNRIYLGLGRDRAYGLGHGIGRFVCLEVEDIHQEPRLVWEDRGLGRTQSTASIHDGLVYIADGRGMLNCYDADTGEVVYREKIGDRGIKERSTLVADGKVYICDERGFMKVYKAGRDPILLGESRLKGPSATVEAVDGLIAIATHRDLYLFGDPKAVEERVE